MQPNKAQYGCPECKKKISATANLSQHLRTHMRLRLQQCPELFEKNSDLQKGPVYHQGAHMAKGAFQHNECENVTIDLTRYSGERLVRCKECKRQFSRKGSLSRHIRNQSCKGLYQATPCDQKCRVRQPLQVSLPLPSEETPWQCKECMKCFGLKRGLKLHQKVHSTDSQHQCTKCRKRYTCVQYLTNHLRMHTKRRDVSNVERDPKYTKYEREFSVQSKFSEYDENHHEPRVNQCAECEQNIRQIDNHVKRHRRLKRVKSYQCIECEAIFAQNTYHIMTERKHSGESKRKMHMIIVRLLEVSVPNEYFVSEQAENEDLQIIADAIREKLNID